MDFEEFRLRYKLTRRQRLVPHLRIWAPHLPPHLIVGLSFMIAAVIVSISRPDIPYSFSFSVALLPPLLSLRGYIVGLLNVLLFPTVRIDMIVQEKTLGLKTTFGVRMWTTAFDGTRSFEQYADDTWTLFLYNGAVITIPSSELTEDQIEHFQGWAKGSGDSEGAVQVGEETGPGQTGATAAGATESFPDTEV